MSSKTNTKIPIKLEIFNEKNQIPKKSNLIQRNPTSTSIKLTKTNKLPEETRINQQKTQKQKHNVQSLSPIKPSFVSSNDKTYGNLNIIPSSFQMQFTHSTPNHNAISPKVLPIFHSNSKKKEVSSKKHLIVRELAVNILELNGYRTRTEQLDSELKNYNKLKQESTGRDFENISEKSDVIHIELEKLKAEMLQKIEDIHKLESELVKIEGHNSQKNGSSQRNEEVMNEIRSMLKDMMENSGQHSVHSNNKIYEEYSRTMQRLTNTSPTIQLKKIESDFIETGEIYRKYNQFRNQIEQDCGFLFNKASDLEFRIKSSQYVEKSMNEIEKFKNSVRIAQDNLEKGKFYLFRDLDCLNTTQSNRLLIANLKGMVEKLLYEKHIKLEEVVKNLYAFMNKNCDESFLTEEENTIKKISDRIHVLRAKIDAKDSLPVFSKRYKHRNNSDGSEDTDTRELQYLNEQIKVLKTKMLAKGDQLNQIKATSSELFQNPSQSSCNTVFLPINHIRNGEQLSTYRTEPLELYDECTSEYIASDNFQNEFVLVRDEQKKYEKKILLPIESELDRAGYHDLKGNQFFYVSKSDDKPMDKKYTSSIEIPAEKVETFKKGHSKRSKSENSSRKTNTSFSSDSETNDYRDKRAKSVVQFKNPLENNALSVSLKSLKRPGPEKQTMTESFGTSSEKYQKEIDDLKKALNQKNEIINRQLDQQRQIEELRSNDSLLNGRKNDALSRKLLQQADEISSLKAQLHEILNDRHKNKEVKSENKIDEDPLVCAVPEHHKLEDLNHQMKAQLNKLKNYIRETRPTRMNDFDLSDKKAEFEALDLAINERKHQLFNLEMAKNIKLDHQFNLDKDSSIIQREICCLEETLRKRNLELHDVEHLIKVCKKELITLKSSKARIEKECETLKKKNSKIKKEMSILNKKADDAATELIAVQEEMSSVKEEKQEIESTIDTLKSEMVNFLKEIRDKDFNEKNKMILSRNYSLNELKNNIIEQRNLLESLNADIESKKKEMDLLKEKSNKYTDLFKKEIDQSQLEIRDLKNNKDNLINQISQIKIKFENYQSEMRTKSHLLEERNYQLTQNEKELARVGQLKDEETKKLSDTEKFLKDKKDEYEHLELVLERLKHNEEDFIKSLEELRSNIEIEKSNFDELKNANEELSSIKIDLKNKVTNLNELLEKMDQEYEIRENEVKNISSLIKEKQIAFKRVENEVNELEYEKETLKHDTDRMNEKLKKKKTELERLEENYKNLEIKLNQSQLEYTDLVKKNNSSKHELENLAESIKDLEYKLKDMALKNQNKQKIFDHLNEKCLEKKDELESMEVYLEEIRNEYQSEKKQLNFIQSEFSKQKKSYEDLKNKNKLLNRSLEENENNSKNLRDLQEEVNEKKKKIDQLEIKIEQKTKDFENLNQDYINNQEELRLIRIKLNNLEEVLKEQAEQHDRFTSARQTINQPASSLLITPNIRKPGNCYSESLENQNESILRDEQMRARETLAKSFQDKLMSLERSKIQTKNIIESLKLNLNDIELLTANNIFKITSS